MSENEQLHLHAVTMVPNRPASLKASSLMKQGARFRKTVPSCPETTWISAMRGNCPPLNVVRWKALLEAAELQQVDTEHCQLPGSEDDAENSRANSQDIGENLNVNRKSERLDAHEHTVSPYTAGLRVLSLSFNALENLTWVSATRFPHLRVLDISHNGLTHLEGLELIRGTLEVLRCNSNMIAKLPTVNAWKSKPFTKLREVWLSRNRLKDYVSSLHTLAVLPKLECLVAYSNPWSHSLAPSQIRSLAEAHLRGLKIFDGKRVVDKDRQRAREYWFNSELGQNILNEISPKVVQRQAKTRSEMKAEAARPWRKGMKKNQSHTSKSKTDRHASAQPVKSSLKYSKLDNSGINGVGRTAQSFGIGDLLQDGIDALTPTTPPRNGASAALPTESPRLRHTEVSVTSSSEMTSAREEPDGREIDSAIGRHSNAGSKTVVDKRPIAEGVGSGIHQAMSMLPDLSSRLKKVGGSRRVKQQARRTQHNHVASSAKTKRTLRKKAGSAAAAAMRNHGAKRKPQKRHWSNPPMGELKRPEIDKKSKTPLLSQAKALVHAANEASELSLAAAVKIGKKEINQEPRVNMPSENGAKNISGNGTDLTINGEESDATSTLRAAKALAAAATAAANQMGQIAAGVGSTKMFLGDKQAVADDGVSDNKEDKEIQANHSKSNQKQDVKKFYKGGVLATLVRKDGSAQARWPNTQLAVSIDRESDGFRTFVQRPGKHAVAVMLDPQGRGSVNRLSGKTLLNFNGDSGGQLLDKHGKVLKKWGSAGNVTDASGTSTTLGPNGSNQIEIKLEEKNRLRATVSLTSKGLKLEIRFRCKGVEHSFVHGQNGTMS